MHHGTSRGKPKRIPRAGSAMTRRRGSAMTHHDLIRMTVDSRVLGHPQSRQTNPNRGPSRAPTGLNLRLTDTSGPAQTSETSQTARGLSAPVGGRALGLRSEGSWLAAELLRAGLEPGAVDRRAGWTGFCPSNDQPSPRCAPAVPLPARPACAAARTRTSTLPVPPQYRPICPLVSQLTTPVCPHSCRGLDEGF